MLLAGATTWYAHHIHVLIICAGAVALAVAEPRSRRLIGVALATVLVVDGVVAASFLDAVAPTLNLTNLSATAWWWPFLQAISLPGLAVVAMFAALFVALRRPPQPSRTEVVGVANA